MASRMDGKAERNSIQEFTLRLRVFVAGNK